MSKTQRIGLDLPSVCRGLLKMGKQYFEIGLKEFEDILNVRCNNCFGLADIVTRWHECVPEAALEAVTATSESMRTMRPFDPYKTGTSL